ncbi:MAG: ATP-binding cassette domain-containing protein [Synergistaceae bacterium]|nr:ATP-binding cassette domain-containing protein [Synergistaceae bacterium]
MDLRLNLQNAVIKYEEKIIIDGVSITAGPGEMIFITGANGSGKSTLIKTIAGLLPLASGKIERAKKISYVPQVEEADRNFPARVKEIVMTGRQRPGKLFYTQRDKELVRDSMRELEIEDLSEHELKILSGGQLRRVMLARALCGLPDLLLLDEPCAGLDVESHKILFEALKKNLARGCAILMVTHDDSDLAGITSSRVINISNGRIL